MADLVDQVAHQPVASGDGAVPWWRRWFRGPLVPRWVMFLASDEDLVAVRRAFMAGGHDGAMTELRRRYLGLTDRTAPRVLDWVLSRSSEPRTDR